jgi:hypothetical protein
MSDTTWSRWNKNTNNCHVQPRTSTAWQDSVLTGNFRKRAQGAQAR